MLLGAVARGAPADTLELRWIQPAGSAPVASFRVYEGSAVGRDGRLVFDGLPTPSNGIYSTRLAIPEGDGGGPRYVWVTAVGPGGESRASRSLVLGLPPPPVGAPGSPRFVVE